MSSDDRWCEVTGLAPTWAGETSGESAEVKRRLAVFEETNREASDVIATLRTKLAMREQQLREADARETAWRKAYVDTFDWFSHMLRDILGGEYVHGDGASVDDARERGRVLAAEFAERLRARLREADAEVARLKADKARLDKIGDEVMRHFTEAPVDASPEPWEGIVQAAIRWRKGMDRGELAREVDIFRGTHEWNRCADPTCSGRGIRTTCKTCAVCRSATVPTYDVHRHTMMISDLKGLAARESGAHATVDGGGDRQRRVLADEPMHHPDCQPLGSGCVASCLVPAYIAGMYETELRPEQYADGAGAQAWRQAMGGKL